TPTRRFATRVRESPCSSLARRWSLARATLRLPSWFRSTVISSGTVWESSPFGPFTRTVRPSRFTSTPAGTGIALRPIRDICCALLPDEGEDFPAHPSLAGLPVGQQPLGRGDDGDAQPTQHARELGGLRVHPQPRPGHPSQAGQAAFPVLAVLELHRQGTADRPLGRLLHRPGGDVPLGLEHLGHVRLQLRVRHRHLIVVRLVPVAQTGQHVCDRVGHGHQSSAFLAPVPGWAWSEESAGYPVTKKPWTRRAVRRGAPWCGCTPGTGRTCGRPPWGGRTAGTACTPGRRTSASGSP